MKEFNKHTIQSRETLKTIAELYGITVDEIVMFHNNNCTVQDIIFINLKQQKELFIPRTAVVDQSKLVLFGTGNRLSFQPENYSYNYGVMISIEKGEKMNEIKYEASVKWLKTENELDFFEMD